MSPKLILHIPHSSTYFPLMEGFTIDTHELEKEVNMLTDWHTDDLFHSDQDDMVIAGFSRIFCDVERFEDDAKEIMSRFGMAALYTKNNDGETIRHVTPELREKILTTYYRPHHLALKEAVNRQLELHSKALIVDCHSFPSMPHNRSLDKNPNRPDFNIGTDSFHTTDALINQSVTFFEKAGYSVGVDWPYKGTIVPMDYYQKNKAVKSIMLEVNRALYVEESTNKRSMNYPTIKNIVGEYIQFMRSTLD